MTNEFIQMLTVLYTSEHFCDPCVTHFGSVTLQLDLRNLLKFFEVYL